MENNRLKKVLQLGIVVPDATKAAEQFCQLFEINQSEIQYFDMRKGSMPMSYKGKPVEAYNVIAMVNVANVEFEFIQYVSGDVNSQKDFLDQCGAGIQHICIAVDSCDEMVEKMTHMGGMVMMEGGDGDIGYKYMDMKESMGLVFEIYNDQLAKIKGI